MDLSELLQRHDQSNLLRAAAESVLQLFMEAKVACHIGAGWHQRTDKRKTWRNVYRKRSLGTCIGALNLKAPKLRRGSYFPGILKPRKTSAKALDAVY